MTLLVADAPAVTGNQTAMPELLPNEWDQATGDCSNPEKVVVAFPEKKAGFRQAVIWLGLRADGTWRAGYYLAAKLKTETVAAAAARPAFPTREAALKAGLTHALVFFEGDAAASRAVSAMLGRLNLVNGPAEGLPPNKPTESSRPLPPSRFAVLALKSIERNPEQPRKDFGAAEMKELAESIASVGLLQPIVVR